MSKHLASGNAKAGDADTPGSWPQRQSRRNPPSPESEGRDACLTRHRRHAEAGQYVPTGTATATYPQLAFLADAHVSQPLIPPWFEADNRRLKPAQTPAQGDIGMQSGAENPYL
jgi:hypothetical protein